jgi:hypothetical protein
MRFGGSKRRKPAPLVHDQRGKKWKRVAAVVGTVALLVVIGRARPEMREFDPAAYTPDEVAVLDAVGSTGERVAAQRHAGRTPVCYVQGPDVARGLKLCRQKGFEIYVIARG